MNLKKVGWRRAQIAPLSMVQLVDLNVEVNPWRRSHAEDCRIVIVAWRCGNARVEGEGEWERSSGPPVGNGTGSYDECGGTCRTGSDCPTCDLDLLMVRFRSHA